MNASTKLLATVAGALLLTACNQQAAEPENVTVNEAADTNYVAEVVALSEPQRRGVMFRAIRDAGLPCQEVKTAEIEPDMTPTTWRAVCEDGRNHLIAMQDNGDATVMSGR